MRKLIPFFALLGALAVHASPFSDAFEPYKKIDRAADQPAFAKFRADLLQVVGRRDAQALKSFLSPQIHYSFGVEKPAMAAVLIPKVSSWRPPGMPTGQPITKRRNGVLFRTLGSKFILSPKTTRRPCRRSAAGEGAKMSRTRRTPDHKKTTSICPKACKIRTKWNPPL